MELNFPVKLEIQNKFGGELGILQKVNTSEMYTGETEVIPNFEKQTLYTKGLAMPKNVTIDAISVRKTTNAAGGNTVYIGGIFDGE